jgi:hypothetical protein
VPRHRRRKRPPQDTSPAPVVIICRDAYHHDEDGYGQRGYHLVGELRQVPPADGRPGRLEWNGHRPESGPLRTPGLVIAADLPASTPPVKRYRTGDGPAPWRIRCICGLDKQPTEAHLAEIIGRWAQAFPGEQCQIPMDRL